jgi:hypothetical protein
MNPLFEKYFFGELNDPEESELETLLEKSEDAAWEFGHTAEQVYNRYGLPAPDLPTGEGGSSETKRKPWLWVIPGLVLLFLAGYWWWNRKASEITVKPEKENAQKNIQVPQVIRETAPRVPVKVSKPIVPPPEGRKEKVAGNNLRVVVKQAVPGPAIVRVLNAMGVEVRRLYNGNLAPGQWAFEWDGRGGDGKLAVPGKYRIEVQAGGITQIREMDIR